MGILAVAVVYAAARYNGDIGVFPDIEVVVDQIVHTAMGDDCRNVYGFTLGAGLTIMSMPGLSVLVIISIFSEF